MCVIAFSIAANPVWPLVIAANRDESLLRPTAPLARWTSPSGATSVSGRDLRDGGTWLGLTPLGRVAMLTNVRHGPPASGELSRGQLVTRWLESNQSTADFENSVEASRYAGFNLVFGDLSSGEWRWCSNRGPDGAELKRPVSRRLAAGLYGLSNAALDTPWPKSLRLRQRLDASVAAAAQRPSPEQDAFLRDQLFSALADRTSAGIDELPATGLSEAQEKKLSSIYIEPDARRYGTVSSAVILVREGKALFAEHRHHVASDAASQLEVALTSDPRALRTL